MVKRKMVLHVPASVVLVKLVILLLNLMLMLLRVLLLMMVGPIRVIGLVLLRRICR